MFKSYLTNNSQKYCKKCSLEIIKLKNIIKIKVEKYNVKHFYFTQTSMIGGFVFIPIHTLKP